MEGNIGYSHSYYEHRRKIVKALGDPSKVYDIRGWIGDCRHFAEKAYEVAISTLNNGGQVWSENNRGERTYLDSGGVENWFNKAMKDMLDMEQENERIARNHGY